MNVSLYQAAAALNSNSQWQDIIAENLASSSVPGYRKQTLATAAVQAGLMSANSANSSNGGQFFVVPKSTSSVSFQSGELNYTGDNKSAAIEGKGFFQVELPNGTTAVTRNGEFQVNSHGQLVTKEGYIVMGQGGGPIQLDTHNSNPIAITSSGEVAQGAEARGRLGVTDFENPELLKQTNGVYFIANDPHLKSKTATGTVRQGYVEGSNASALGEMANMMTASRTFEANQKVIQIQDDRLGKTISDLGNPGQG